MAWKTSFGCVDFWYFFNTNSFCGYVKNAIFDRFRTFLRRKQKKNNKNANKKTIDVTIRKYGQIFMFGNFPPFSGFFGHFLPFLTIFLKLPCWVAVKQRNWSKMQEQNVNSEIKLVEIPGTTRHWQGMAWKASFSCVDFLFFFNTNAFCDYVLGCSRFAAM